LCLASIVAGNPSHALRAEPVAGLEALGFAYRFASAIEKDPKDQAKAQELVIGELVVIGALDEALQRAETVKGWRRGSVYADLATALARQGKPQRARGLVEQARAVQSSVSGWEGRRILAHVAQALAALGDEEGVAKITRQLAESDPLQYAGRSAATEAVASAVRGEYGEAMERMKTIQGSDDIEIAWWRTAGYLAVAREKQLDAPKRIRALDAASASAEGIPGWRRAEALESIAEEYESLGRRDSARSALRSAQQVLKTSSDSTEQAALLSNLARSWAGIGEKKRAREILRDAEASVAGALGIDRPGIYANLGSSYLRVGDRAEARRLYDRALEAAAALENSRPRALAVTAICRQMGRSGVELDGPTRDRLEALLSGLGDPW
jgi:tetratricopeptide (TPR) repeat protein